MLQISTNFTHAILNIKSEIKTPRGSSGHCYW